ncbi:MAG TPA: hypothetical protein PLR64_03405 [Candidatus Dojkabacteria bacterium]|nr:hypothetical protein [Candidatus Dojkabacteria bacterium]
MAKKNSYITDDLLWAEEQLESWKEYVSNNPINKLKDRIEWKTTKTGGTLPLVVSSIEAQGKFIQETMKNYLSLLEVVDKLREREEAKIESRGKDKITGQANKWIKTK